MAQAPGSGGYSMLRSEKPFKSSTRNPRWALFVPGLLVLGAVYYVAAKLGLRLAYQNPSATPIWPPTGIALAALLLWGYRFWPAIFGAAGLANFTITGSIGTSLAIATGNTLEGLLGAFLVNRFAGGRDAFERPANILRWTMFTAVLAPAVSASVGLTSLTIAGHAPGSDFGAIWLTWWLGDAGGALVVAPFLILWGRDLWFGWNARRILETAILLALVCLLAESGFGVPFGIPHRTHPLAFAFLPVLGWAAFRLDARATATVAAAVSVLAVWGTLRGQGPFAVQEKNESLLLVQAFLAVTTTTSLALAAAVQERRRAQRQVDTLNVDLERRVVQRSEEVFRSQAMLAQAESVARLGSWEWDLVTNTVLWSDELYRIFGMDRAAFTPGYDAFFERVHPDDRPWLKETVGLTHRDGRPFDVFHRIVRPDGAIRTLRSRGQRITDPAGRPTRMYGTGQDVTEEKELERQAQLRALEQARREQAEASAGRASFLAEAGAVLASSLDYATTLSKVAELAVTTLADWCMVHVQDPLGAVRQITLRHRNPAMVRVAEEFGRRYPFDPNGPRGAANVLRTGRSEIYPEISEELLRRIARDDGHFRSLRDLGLTSAMIVPIQVRGRTLGALTFVAAASGTRYGAEDLALAQSLADRAGLAVENANLYAQAQREIEERKRALEAVREGEARLARTEAFSLVMATHVGLDGRWLKVPPTLCGLLGYSEADLLSTTFMAVTHPDDVEADWARCQQLIRGEIKSYDLEKRYVRKDGGTVWAYINSSIVSDAQGKPVHFLTYIRDITDRKRSEDDQKFLAEAGETLASSLDYRSSLDNIVRLAVPRIADFCMIQVREDEGRAPRSAALRHVRPEKETVLRTLDSLPMCRDSSVVQAFRTGEAELLPEIAPAKIEAAASSPEQLALLKELDLRSSISAPLVVRGRTLGVLLLATTGDSGRRYGERDLALVRELARRAALVMENARLYQMQQDFNRTLESQVEERTAELQEALAELEGFSYTVAHDLRAPLRALASFSGLLQEDYGSKLDEGGREYLQRIARAARRMDELVQDLLAYSKLSREKVEPDRVNVESLVAEIVAQMESELTERKARVKVERPIPEVRAHRVMLGQALLNLIGNAVKFVNPGVDPQVRIYSEERGKNVRIWVQDNGIGIPSQYHRTIFDIFHQLEPGRFPGTGVGLAIVRKAVERMKGESGVESMPGQGSRFWIELPAAEGDHGTRVHRAVGRRQSGRPADSGAGLPESGAAGHAPEHR